MYRRTKEHSLPKPSRKYKSAFEDTREWKMMREDLEKGLKPGEALEVSLSGKDLERIGLLQRNIARWIGIYLERNGMTKYKVLNFRRAGLTYIVVKHPAPATSTATKAAHIA